MPARLLGKQNRERKMQSQHIFLTGLMETKSVSHMPYHQICVDAHSGLPQATGQAFLFNVFFVFFVRVISVESQAFRERVSRNQRFCGSESRVCHVWVCVILWVQSGFVLRVRLGSAGCSSVEDAGGEGCVIWRDKKRARNQPQKGREVEVTFTVRERTMQDCFVLNAS